MKRMRDLEPKMKALKEKYKDDPNTLNKKTMELYKEEEQPFEDVYLY